MYSIWLEGYAATGERGHAEFLGKEEGKTFKEAVRNRIGRGDLPQTLTHLDTSADPPRWWGCRFFDNEKDARKVFG